MKPRILNAARLSFPLATAIAALLAAPSANAANQNWIGGVTNANWGTANNWSGAAAPGSTSITTSPDVATFNAAITNTWGLVGSPILINSTTQNIGGISFTTAAGSYFVGTTAGNSLRLTSGGTIQILAGLTATNAVETINAPLVIQLANGTYTFANNSANGSGAGAGTLNFAGGITGGVAGATVLTINGTNTNANTISGIIGNGTATSLAVVKNGTGTWVLGGANTFSGSLDIAAGRLRVSSASAVGTSGTIVSNSSSTNTVFAATGASALSFSRSFSLNTGPGAITFGDTTGTGDLTFTGNLTRAGGTTTRTINVAGTTTVTFNGDLLSPGTPTAATTFTKGGTGTLAIKGLGSTTDGGFSNVIVTGGTLSVTRLANLGAACSLGRATGATAGAVSITLDGGILSYIDGGAAASTTDRLLQIGRTTAAAVGTIRNEATNAAQTVTFSNTDPIAYGNPNQTRSLVLGGANTGMNTFASEIGDNGTAAVSLAKQNAGTWLLSGTNTYTGSTSVTGGTLALSGSGSVNNSSGITVNGSGAKLVQTSSVAATPTVTLTQGTLTGNGTVGVVNFGAGTGGIISNNDGVGGASLTTGALTFNGAAAINTFHVAGNSTPAIVASSVSTNVAGFVTLNPNATSWTNGTYTLLSYGGGSIGGAGTGQITLGTVSGLSARQTPGYTDTGAALNLTISGDTPKWTGLDNGNWQTGTTGASENWVLQVGNTPVSYLTNDDVLFDDTAVGVTAINVNAANVSPFATVFNNTNKNYTLGSTGGFGIASGGLTKNGLGSLTITNANTYSGNTVINSGLVDVSTDGAQLYSGASPISAIVTVNNGAVLVVKNFGQASTTGLGSCSLGNLANSGGQVILDGGTVRFNNETAARGRVVNINAGGGTLDVVNNSTYSMTAASMIFSGSNNVLTLTGDSSSTGAISTVMGGTGVSVVKNGDAKWTLTGTNTYSGGTTINASSGTLQATVTTTINSLGTGAVSVGSGSTLILNNTATSGTIPINNTFTGSGLLKLQFAANATARNTTMPNVTGFGGTIQLSSLGATGDKWNGTNLGTIPGSLVVDSGNTLYVASGTTVFTSGITINGPGSSESRGAIRVGNSTSVVGGNINLATDSTISMESVAAQLTGNITSGAAGTQTLTLGGTGSAGGILSGVIGGGTGTLNLATAVGGTYTLTNTNTYTGTTTVAAGTLQLGNGTVGNDGTIGGTSGVTNDGTLIFNRFGSSSAAYPISGSGAVIKTGVGTQTLAGANTYSGATTVNAGTLSLNYSTQDNNKLSDTATLTLSGGTLNLSGGTHTEVVASTTLTTGTSSFVTRTGGSAVLQMGLITNNAGATIDFGAPNIATTSTLNNVNGILGTWATINNGSDWAVNSTNAVDGLITAASYTDVTRLNGGTQIIADNSSASIRIIEGTGSAANITLAAATTSIATLNQSTVGGTSAAVINPAGQTLATSAILVGTGAGALTIGTGVNNGNLQALNVGGDLTVNATGSTTVTVNSAITDNASSTLTMLGSGTLALNGNNSFAGGTNFGTGTLKLGSTTALGAGTLTIAGGSLDSSIANLVNANNNAQVWNGDYTFVGTQNLDLGTGAVTLGSNRQVTVNANTLAVGGAIGGAFALTKAGYGTLLLYGNSTYTGNTLVRAGILNISGTGSLTGNTTATSLSLQPTVSGDSAIVNYSSSATSTFFTVVGASVAGTASVLNQSDGVIQITPNVTTSTQSVVGNPGAYGAYNISGGTFRDTTGTPGGSRFTVGGLGTASATNGTITGVRVGIVNVSGTGFIDHTNAEWWLNYSLGQINVTDSGKIDHTGSNQPFGIIMNSAVVGGGYGVLNIAGTGAQVITGAQPLRYGNTTTANNGDGLSAFVNLAAGTLSTGTIGTTSLPAAPTATNFICYNYAGGTLKATGTLATGWTPTSGASATVINTIYGAINNSAVAGAPSFTGGLSVDTNNNDVTVPTAQPLLGATGVGVTQANLSVSGGSGYIGAPSVTFSRPAAANGVAASGYAIVSGGAVTGIVITNPGVYASTETPTIQLLGGFASGAGTEATVTSSALTTSNTSGGLTKTGLGTLTITGTGNTYTGLTTISAGTLQLGDGTSGNDGTISNTSGVTNNSSLIFNRFGTSSASYAISGTGAVTKLGAGTQTLSGASNYTGATTLSAGTLSIGTVANIGAASPIGAGDNTDAASNTASLVFNGGTLAFTGASGTTDRGFTMTGAGTISFPAGNNNALTFGGNLTGAGTLTLNGASTVGLQNVLTLSGSNAGFTGNVTATVGGIKITNSTALGSGTKTITLTNGTNGNPNIQLDGSGGDITLPSSFTYSVSNATNNGVIVNIAGNNTVAGQINNTSGGGAFKATSLGGNLTISANYTATTTLRSVALDGSSNGTFSGIISNGSTVDLPIQKAGAGTWTLTGVNTYSGATTITAGTLQLGDGTTGNDGTIANTSSVINNASLVFNRFGSSSASYVISGTGSVTKLGAGTQTLAGANTYSGNTIVSAGTLDLATTGQLKFVLGATSGVNNSLTGAGTVTLNGSFAIDTTAADSLPSGSWTLENVPSLAGPYGATFIVAGFTDAGSDKWTKVNGSKIYTFDETTGILTLAPAGGYDTWKTQITNGLNLRTDDADGDGFNNLQEFLFGTSPIANNGSLVSTTASGGNLILRWLQRETGSTYTLKESSTLGLGSWTTSGQVPALDGDQTGAPTDYDYFKVTIPTGSGKLFFRIEGVEN